MADKGQKELEFDIQKSLINLKEVGAPAPDGESKKKKKKGGFLGIAGWIWCFLIYFVIIVILGVLTYLVLNETIGSGGGGGGGINSLDYGSGDPDGGGNSIGNSIGNFTNSTNSTEGGEGGEGGGAGGGGAGGGAGGGGGNSTNSTNSTLGRTCAVTNGRVNTYLLNSPKFCYQVKTTLENVANEEAIKAALATRCEDLFYRGANGVIRSCFNEYGTTVSPTTHCVGETKLCNDTQT